MKKRLDLIVSEKEGISREKAQALIMAGAVLVDNIMVDKCGIQIDELSTVTVKETFPYVSRGALKLKEALDQFNLDFAGKTICDVGASTGGFTDFSLQAGAIKVYAIDTGKGQIAQKLRDDKRVVLYENANIRNVVELPEPIDFFVIDVSFISLTKVLPQCRVIDPKASVIALVKPQFEVGKEMADKTRGIIKDEKVQLETVQKIGQTAEELGYSVEGICQSPITGAKGNREFLLYLRYE